MHRYILQLEQQQIQQRELVHTNTQYAIVYRSMLFQHRELRTSGWSYHLLGKRLEVRGHPLVLPSMTQSHNHQLWEALGQVLLLLG
jgi:hypothetical protein